MNKSGPKQTKTDQNGKGEKNGKESGINTIYFKMYNLVKQVAR